MEGDRRLTGMLLETERLILRPLTQDDVDAIYAVIGDPIAMQHYPRTFAREDAVEWIERNRRWHERDGYSLLAVVLKSTGKVIGDCGLSWQLADDTPMLELGYHLQRDEWGHGYATEAARACMDYAFHQLSAEKLVSLILAENQPSRRVAERNGMRVERQVMHSGRQHLLYAITRENYGQT
jgi:[ribosomal protein S5]-alanine N-acetyltransferase